MIITLSKKKYTALDALWLTFQVTPVCTALHLLFSIMHAIMPTAAIALATANFVDTAIDILKEGRSRDEMYIPLFLLLLVLGVITTAGSVGQLISSRITLNLQRKLMPEVVRIHAALDFKHIENAGSWELISRVSRDPVKSVMDGVSAYMQFLQIVVCVTSVMVLIITQVWWAAFIILAFSIPMFWLSVRAGKKNYQAGRDAERFNRRTEYLDEVLTGRENVDERTLFEYGDNVNKRWQAQYEAGRKLQLKVIAKYWSLTAGKSSNAGRMIN